MWFIYACWKLLSSLSANKALCAAIGERNACALCETREMLIYDSHTKKGIFIHCIFKKVKKNIQWPGREKLPWRNKSNRYKVPLRGACLLGLTCIRKSWFQCPASAEGVWYCRSCCCPHWQRGKKQAAGRRYCLCREEEWKGRGGGRAWVIVSTSHGPASPVPQSAGAQLHTAFALKLLLILYPATRKAASFAKAMKCGFKSQGQALFESKWEKLHGIHWSWLRILPSVFMMLLSMGYKQPATVDTLCFRVDFSLLQRTY